MEKQLSNSFNVFFYYQINFLVIKSAFWTKYFNFDHCGLYSSKCSNSNSCFLCVVSSNGEVKSTKLWSIQDKPMLQENPASHYLTPFWALTLQFTGIFSTILDRSIGLRVTLYVACRGNKINHLPVLVILFIRSKKSLVYPASSTLHECVYMYLMIHIIFNQMSGLMSLIVKFSVNAMWAPL